MIVSDRREQWKLRVSQCSLNIVEYKGFYLLLIWLLSGILRLLLNITNFDWGSF